ncbi:hypothetical protein RCL1_004807 [Eukaryota sp. TZLM3-RCL]
MTEEEGTPNPSIGSPTTPMATDDDGLDKMQKRKEQHRLSARNYRARKKAEASTMQTRIRDIAAQNEALLRENMILRESLANPQNHFAFAGKPQPEPHIPVSSADLAVRKTKHYAQLLTQLRNSIENPNIPDKQVAILLDELYCQLLGICNIDNQHCEDCPYSNSEQCLCAQSEPAFNHFSGRPSNHVIASSYPCIQPTFNQPTFDLQSRVGVVYPGNLYPCINNCTDCRNLGCPNRFNQNPMVPPVSAHPPPPLSNPVVYPGNVYPCINNCTDCKNLNCPNRSVARITERHVPGISPLSIPLTPQEQLSCQSASLSLCQPFLLGQMFALLYTGGTDSERVDNLPRNKSNFERWIREELVSKEHLDLEEVVEKIMKEMRDYEVQIYEILAQKRQLIVQLWAIASPYALHALSVFSLPFTTGHCSLSPGPDMKTFGDLCSRLCTVVAQHHKLMYGVLRILREYSVRSEAKLFLGRHPFGSEAEFLDTLLRMML